MLNVLILFIKKLYSPSVLALWKNLRSLEMVELSREEQILRLGVPNEKEERLVDIKLQTRHRNQPVDGNDSRSSGSLRAFFVDFHDRFVHHVRHREVCIARDARQVSLSAEHLGDAQVLQVVFE
uniref:Putative secreted protein n=1 Tax=Ixodes ricinus TaxID=34613 RepID=A0A6B0UQ37_IXORI